MTYAENNEVINDLESDPKRKYDEFIAAYEAGYKEQVIEKFPLLVEAAQTGHIDSVFTIGLFYSKGEYLEKNVEKANEYLTITANEGHVQSQVLLGLNYQELGWEMNHKQAKEYIKKSNYWFEKASSTGDSVATRELAASIFRYSNDEKEIARAESMLNSLANKGDKKAMYYLSVYLDAKSKDTSNEKFKELADFWLNKSQKLK